MFALANPRGTAKRFPLTAIVVGMRPIMFVSNWRNSCRDVIFPPLDAFLSHDVAEGYRDEQCNSYAHSYADPDDFLIDSLVGSP